MKEFEFNPFGSRQSTYAPNSAAPNKKETKGGSIIKRAAQVVGVILILIIVALYISMLMYSGEKKKEANGAISHFNEKMAIAYETFSDPELPGKLNESADKASKASSEGEENREVKATRLLANMSASITGVKEVPKFNEKAPDEDMAVTVAPYFAMCDLSNYVVSPATTDIKTMCGAFDDSAREMMSSIRAYNQVADSFIGAVTFTTEHYADVMSKSEK